MSKHSGKKPTAAQIKVLEAMQGDGWLQANGWLRANGRWSEPARRTIGVLELRGWVRLGRPNYTLTDAGLAAFKKATQPHGERRMKKPNATLEWKGRSLMLNGIMEVAFIYEDKTDRGPVFWWKPPGREYRTEEACRRAVNRRFKLTEEV